MAETGSSSTSGSSGGRGSRSSSSTSTGDAKASAEATSEDATPAEAPAAAPEAPAEAPAADSGELRWYRAIVSMGEGDSAVKAMQKFTATADDPRVLSGWVTPLGPVVPDDVSEAFGKLEGGIAGGVGQASS